MANRGGQPGNQNARKHGFYSRTMTETDKLEMEEAGDIEGLDDEIAVLRVKLNSLLRDQPDRIDLHIRAISMISRLVKTQYSINPDRSKEERRSKNIENVRVNLAEPLGWTGPIPLPPD